MDNKRVAKLILENGMEFEGFSFGHDQPVTGEIVFNTSMVGYPEMLTDPSYHGQILCLTYPLIGNYGIPSMEKTKEGLSKHLESDKSQPNGLVVFDYSEHYSNWEAAQCLDSWMKEQKLTGIYGVDTRELTKILRDSGQMRAVIIPESTEFLAQFFEKAILNNQVEEVSTKEIISYKADGSNKITSSNGLAKSDNQSKILNGKNKKVILIDCGVKHSLIRDLLKRGIEVVRVPYNYDFTAEEYDGVYISNGPGNPKELKETIKIVQKSMEQSKPIFGIQLGCQILGLAAGCQIERLQNPHRAANIPVRKTGTNRAYISSQNSSYAIVRDSVPVDWDIIFTNLNDNSVAGIKHNFKPFYGTMFNPDVCIGLNEGFTTMDEFLSKI